MSHNFSDNPALVSRDLEPITGEKESVLPRLAWNDRVAYFKVLFKAKKNLDKIEKIFNRSIE